MALCYVILRQITEFLFILFIIQSIYSYRWWYVYYNSELGGHQRLNQSTESYKQSLEKNELQTEAYYAGD